MTKIFDPTPCKLGEGPLWHPLRQTLFWFDIESKRLYERGEQDTISKHWQFNEHVSAAGWLDETKLLIASETALFEFDLDSEIRRNLVALESDNPLTRSNDGRADPYGGFWVGTMGKKTETGAGAIYRFFNGELRKLFASITISNSICFSPDKKTAYFADTPKHQIMQVALDKQGWPVGQPELFVDLTKKMLNPDGSVVDVKGCLWNAQLGAHRVARYDPSGKFITALEMSASQISCPAFGGKKLDQLFATSATIDLDPKQAESEMAGATFYFESAIAGQKEYRIKLRE